MADRDDVVASIEAAGRRRLAVRQSGDDTSAGSFLDVAEALARATPRVDPVARLVEQAVVRARRSPDGEHAADVLLDAASLARRVGDGRAVEWMLEAARRRPGATGDERYRPDPPVPEPPLNERAARARADAEDDPCWATLSALAEAMLQLAGLGEPPAGDLAVEIADEITRLTTAALDPDDSDVPPLLGQAAGVRAVRLGQPVPPASYFSACRGCGVRVLAAAATTMGRLGARARAGEVARQAEAVVMADDYGGHDPPVPAVGGPVILGEVVDALADLGQDVEPLIVRGLALVDTADLDDDERYEAALSLWRCRVDHGDGDAPLPELEPMHHGWLRARRARRSAWTGRVEPAWADLAVAVRTLGDHVVTESSVWQALEALDPGVVGELVASWTATDVGGGSRRAARR
jgi:hypothetical protein